MTTNKTNGKKSRTPDPDAVLELGTWVGRHQAFGMIASRCSAADAECLKKLRDSGQYKQLDLNWTQFCEERAGISRRHADRLIGYLEEFGANYFRLAELVPVSSDTYRLIAGAVSDEGLEFDGRKIPLTEENRKQVVAAVESLRAKGNPKGPREVGPVVLCRRLAALLEDAQTLKSAGEILIMIALLQRGTKKLETIYFDRTTPAA